MISKDSEQSKQGDLAIISKNEAIIATPMIAQFLEIKETVENCLLFYRMGDFYELFFDDALKAAKILDITLTKRGQYQGQDIPMCGVPIHSHESYLHRLIESGQKVAICEQLEDPKEAKKRGAKSVVKRGIVRIVTPGTITEDNLLDTRAHNYLCAIFESRGKIAIAWLDISTGDFYSRPTSIHNLASLLHQIDSKEILIPEEKKLLFQEIIQEFQEFIHFLPLSQYDAQNAEKNLCEFFSCAEIKTLGDFSEHEIASAGCLLNYVKLMQINKMPHIRPLMQAKNSNFMEIDIAARRNLEICHSLYGKNNTLLHAIDNTKSAGGGRLIKEWLSAPLYNMDMILERYDAIDYLFEFKKLAEILDSLKLHGDPERALNRLNLERGSPRDMKVISNSLNLALNIKAILAEIYPNAPIFIKNIFDELHNLSNLNEKLTRALSDELPAIIKDSFFIRQGYSAQLDHVKNLANDSRTILKALEQKYRKESGIESLKIKQNNVLGTFIEIPARHSQKLAINFIHRQSTANSARFTTNDLEKCARDIMEAREKALAIELEVFENLRIDICAKNKEILDIARSLSKIDVIASHIEFITGSPAQFCRPKINESQNLEIIKGRHIVIEKAEQKNGKDFIANDCTLNENQFLWLITGPNMAGKSTFLRQNALIIILAQAGFFVPAEAANIGLVDKLFSRVGASDNIAKGHSTFMVEMLETSSILNRATDKSFVILDEIGRGTATFDGLSLAHAIVEYLHNILRARTLFATHYHELNQLQESCDGVYSAHVQVKEYKNEIIFTHSVAMGSAKRSYGIHVAKLAGIPNEILHRAEEVLDLLENQKNDAHLKINPPNFELARVQDTQNFEAINFLKKIDPNNLSPREALDCLYQLKQLSSEQ